MYYEIYIDGTLRKITKSMKCVDAIIDKFVNNHVKDSTLTVEVNGKVMYEVGYF